MEIVCPSLPLNLNPTFKINCTALFILYALVYLCKSVYTPAKLMNCWFVSIPTMRNHPINMSLCLIICFKFSLTQISRFGPHNRPSKEYHTCTRVAWPLATYNHPWNHYYAQRSPSGPSFFLLFFFTVKWQYVQKFSIHLTFENFVSP